MGFLADVIQTKLKLPLVEPSFPKVIGFGFWQSPKHPKSILMHPACQEMMYDNWVYPEKMLLHSKCFFNSTSTEVEFYKSLGSTAVDPWPVFLQGFFLKRMP